MNKLIFWANYYYNMGFNVTHIDAKKNQSAKNPYKSATNNRYLLQNRRQELSELQSLDWENSDGIGVVLGFNNLRAIDFDFYCYEWQKYKWLNEVPTEKTEKIICSIVQKALSKLKLPSNYEWVIRTPNGGFHILIYSEPHPFNISQNKTKAFVPNKKYYEKYGGHFFNDNCVPRFSHLELRWDKHLVLPPSTNAESKTYQILSNNIPNNPPKVVTQDVIIALLNEFCYDEVEKESGYNLFLSIYEEEAKNSNEWEWNYGENEFLDMFPVYLKNSKKDVIPNDWLK